MIASEQATRALAFLHRQGLEIKAMGTDRCAIGRSGDTYADSPLFISSDEAVRWTLGNPGKILKIARGEPIDEIELEDDAAPAFGM